MGLVSIERGGAGGFMFVQFVRQSWAGLGLVMGCVVQNRRRVAEMKGGGDGGAVRVCCRDEEDENNIIFCLIFYFLIFLNIGYLIFFL